ncbi:hypothetical protein PVAND_004266 [Polypedilum vanderplanki]|uniref:Uncharacterized protein n=1 Tax=Polypedilum vanderplanki TaxID=319348 RepID=A0A9J6BWL6_POLVA|nr:hypothetical protein PVAND_004266 [Polypedilum vanderplanki]
MNDVIDLHFNEDDIPLSDDSNKIMKGELSGVIVKTWTSGQGGKYNLNSLLNHFKDNGLKIFGVIKSISQSNTFFIESVPCDAFKKYFLDLFEARQSNVRVKNNKRGFVLNFCHGKFKIITAGQNYNLMVIKDAKIIWTTNDSVVTTYGSSDTISLLIHLIRSHLMCSELMKNITDILMKILQELNADFTDLVKCIHVRNFGKKKFGGLIIIENNKKIFDALKYKFVAIKECSIIPVVVNNSVIPKALMKADDLSYKSSSYIFSNDFLRNSKVDTNHLSKFNDNATFELMNSGIFNINKVNTINIYHYHPSNSSIKKRSIFERLGGFAESEDNVDSSIPLNDLVERKGSIRVNENSGSSNKKNESESYPYTKKRKLKSVVIKVAQLSE